MAPGVTQRDKLQIWFRGRNAKQRGQSERLQASNEKFPQLFQLSSICFRRLAILFPCISKISDIRIPQRIQKFILERIGPALWK